jgi:hypothetical protein
MEGLQAFGDLVAENKLFRVFVILIGVGVMLLGYRMYLNPNAPRSAGLVEGGTSGTSLKVRGTAGTFFLLMGAAIALAGILHRSSAKTSEQTTRVLHSTDSLGRQVVETVHTIRTFEYSDTAVAQYDTAAGAGER